VDLAQGLPAFFSGWGGGSVVGGDGILRRHFFPRPPHEGCVWVSVPIFSPDGLGIHYVVGGDGILMYH